MFYAKRLTDFPGANGLFSLYKWNCMHKYVHSNKEIMPSTESHLAAFCEQL